jgi:hypothetical protein
MLGKVGGWNGMPATNHLVCDGGGLAREGSGRASKHLKTKIVGLGQLLPLANDSFGFVNLVILRVQTPARRSTLLTGCEGNSGSVAARDTQRSAHFSFNDTGVRSPRLILVVIQKMEYH